MDVKWHFTVALVCISLMTIDVEHLFMFIGHLYILFGKNVYSNPLPIVNWIVSFCCCVVNILYIFQTLDSHKIAKSQILPPIIFLLFLIVFTDAQNFQF